MRCNDNAYYILTHVLCTRLLSNMHKCQHATLRKMLHNACAVVIHETK